MDFKVFDNVMQIFAQTSTGKLTLDVVASDTIENVKAKIKVISGILAEDQVLSQRGLHMEDGKTLSDYDIFDGQTITMRTIAEAIAYYSAAEAIAPKLSPKPSLSVLTPRYSVLSDGFLSSSGGVKIDREGLGLKIGEKG